MSEVWAALAGECGVVTDWWDWRGQRHEVPESTVRAVLAAMGVEATEDALVARHHRRWRSALPPTVAGVEGEPVEVVVRVPHGWSVELRLTREDGTTEQHLVAGDVVEEEPAEGRVAVRVRLPGQVAGYHELEVDGDRSSLIVAPPRLPEAPRCWGWMVQLYALRSKGSWGIGDIGDLGALVEWSAGQGADLVLINPLHASALVPPIEPSPYSPSSRRFLSPLWLRVQDLPEYAAAPASVRAQVDALAPELADRIDRDAAWAAKQQALELLFPGPPGADLAPGNVSDPAEPFPTARSAPDWAGVDDDLLAFATWAALTEVHGPDHRDWPAPLQVHASAAVTEERERLRDRVELHLWLQRRTSEQLLAAQDSARSAGMTVGVVHDLAVGIDPAGADVWTHPELFALDCSIGAPPDAFNQLGQTWGLAPLRPDALAAQGFRPWRELVRASLVHGGGVRIDHVLGLSRMWWVPPGVPASEGAYVRYDLEAMLAVVVLEAARAGAVVIGEDLGTVEPSLQEALRSKGVLGCDIGIFQHTDDLWPLRPEQWRELAAASVTSHDLPTAVSFWRDEHIAIRDRLGLLGRSAEEEKQDAAAFKQRLQRLMIDLGIVGEQHTEDDLVVGMHELVSRSPARIAMASVADAVGDLRQPNLPGTKDEWPNWRLPLADVDGRLVLLEELVADPRTTRLAQAMTRGRARSDG